MNLFELNNKIYKHNSTNENIESVDLKYLNSNLKYCKIVRNKVSRLRKILNIFYEQDPFFRFTSRFINSITVSFVAFYYFVFSIGMIIIYYVTLLTNILRLFFLTDKNSFLDLLKNILMY